MSCKLLYPQYKLLIKEIFVYDNIKQVAIGCGAMWLSCRESKRSFSNEVVDVYFNNSLPMANKFSGIWECTMARMGIRFYSHRGGEWVEVAGFCKRYEEEFRGKQVLVVSVPVF
ncbi:hypothetical protein, partial [Moorena sp. SIO3B2]|uniref:hypothetical protein n=1 Tax=Moorena sp. SIO3B2 TaxID=2607827 RepID=UPI0013CC9FA9